MYEKKKRPYMTFLFLLIPVLALSYLVGCFFNVQENLLYILNILAQLYRNSRILSTDVPDVDTGIDWLDCFAQNLQ